MATHKSYDPGYEPRTVYEEKPQPETDEGDGGFWEWAYREDVDPDYGEPLPRWDS